MTTHTFGNFLLVTPMAGSRSRLLLMSVFVAVILATSPAFAGNDGKGNQHHDRRDAQGRDYRDGANANYFNDHHRATTREYYDESVRSGRCPPGLAKKHNGCLPPGQAKKWHRGQPLPRDVIFYDLPPSMVVRLGPPPTGQRYVRVASDILLIAIGSGMVIDAIQDIGR